MLSPCLVGTRALKIDHEARKKLPAQEMAPGCCMGRQQAGTDSVMLWTMFSWETLGHNLHVDVNFTHTTYLNIVKDQVHPILATVYSLIAMAFFSSIMGPATCKKLFRIPRF